MKINNFNSGETSGDENAIFSFFYPPPPTGHRRCVAQKLIVSYHGDIFGITIA
jgi:hypothetical protein